MPGHGGQLVESVDAPHGTYSHSGCVTHLGQHPLGGPTGLVCDAEFFELGCVRDDLVIDGIAEQPQCLERFECCSARGVVGGRGGLDELIEEGGELRHDSKVQEHSFEFERFPQAM